MSYTEKLNEVASCIEWEEVDTESLRDVETITDAGRYHFGIFEKMLGAYEEQVHHYRADLLYDVVQFVEHCRSIAEDKSLYRPDTETTLTLVGFRECGTDHIEFIRLHLLDCNMSVYKSLWKITFRVDGYGDRELVLYKGTYKEERK